MKFRKKPVVIDAVQLTWANWSEMCAHVGEGLSEGFRGLNPEEARALFPDKAAEIKDGAIYAIVPTKEGCMLASEGDWIIRGVAGEFYPCNPEIFAQTYERVIDFDTPMFPYGVLQ